VLGIDIDITIPNASKTKVSQGKTPHPKEINPATLFQQYAAPSLQFHKPRSLHANSSQRPPEVVCVEVTRELRINVDDMNISLLRVADNGFVVRACCRIGFDVDTECTVEF
jgi:hypothetical protein